MIHVTLIVDDSVVSPPWTESFVQATLRKAAGYIPQWPLQEKAHVNVRLTDDPTMIYYNKTYRHQDKVTNVLSFPVYGPDQPFLSTPEGFFLGDILVCWPEVMRQAQSQGKTQDHHGIHLLVHSLLHLLHYDHNTDAKAAIMESLETKILAAMGIDDPY